MNCDDYFYSGLIDGVLFYDYLGEDTVGCGCEHYVNVFRLREIFDSVKKFLKIDNMIKSILENARTF